VVAGTGSRGRASHKLSYYERTWYYWLDPELKIIHSRRNCSAAKIAIKYQYLRNVQLKDKDQEGARELDKVGKVCDICFRWEHMTKKRKISHQIPPGFRRGAQLR